MSEAITPAALETLFTGARTHNGWLDIPVSDETLREIYDLMKWGRRPPTAPRRALSLCEARKEKRSCARRSPAATLRKRSPPRSRQLSPDSEFYERLPVLFPHGDARSWFTSSPALAEETAFRNSSMQAAYLIFACRALGLDTGPMSGFDREKVDAAFSRARCLQAIC